MPSTDANPLLPTRDPSRPTELPAGEYDIAVFENRFPSLSLTGNEDDVAPDVTGALTHPARGQCEVVVFSQDPDQALARLPLDHVQLLLEVWADRTGELAAKGLQYVLPFENRGAEMGVTLHHPHGQIYAYGFLPRAQAQCVAALREHLRACGEDLVLSLAASERKLGTRVVAVRQYALAFVPPFARFPYELWVTPLQPRRMLGDLTPAERRDVAAVLSESLRRLDGLWGQPMPYLLTVNQAPTDGEDHDEWTLRIEIWPIRRASDKLKFLAGTELGAGVFACDVLPEDAARQLRDVML